MSGPHSGGFHFFDLFDSSLRIFYCFWYKFESIFLVRPSFLWTHVPQLTLRSSRYAALATQFTLHSSPTVWWVNFIWFLLFSFYLFSLNFSFLLEVTFKSKSWYWWSLWGLGALIRVLNHLTVSVWLLCVCICSARRTHRTCADDCWRTDLFSGIIRFSNSGKTFYSFQPLYWNQFDLFFIFLFSVW